MGAVDAPFPGPQREPSPGNCAVCRAPCDGTSIAVGWRVCGPMCSLAMMGVSRAFEEARRRLGGGRLRSGPPP